MDAVVDGRPVTPRHGQPVEISALWYNALAFATIWPGASTNLTGRIPSTSGTACAPFSSTVAMDALFTSKRMFRQSCKS